VDASPGRLLNLLKVEWSNVEHLSLKHCHNDCSTTHLSPLRERWVEVGVLGGKRVEQDEVEQSAPAR
jgi:hypothetical protein